MIFFSKHISQLFDEMSTYHKIFFSVAFYLLVFSLEGYIAGKGLIITESNKIYARETNCSPILRIVIIYFYFR